MTQQTSRPRRAGDRIDLGIRLLAERYPFHAAVLERLRVTCDETVGTMGVTPRGEHVLLLFNTDFVLGLPPAELGGVLLHETNHIVLGHLTADPKDYPDVWARTVAEEVTVNEYVKEPLPQGGITLALFPDLPPLESTAQRYRRLRKIEKRVPISTPSALLDLAGKGVLHTPDDHSVWQRGQEDRDAALEVIQAVLHEAAVQAGTDCLPEGLREALEEMAAGTSPGGEQYQLRGDRQGRLDWRRLLRRHVGQLLAPDASLARPPRRFPHLAGIVPGRSRRPTRPKVMAVIDTSGSMTERLLEAVDGELRRLARCHSVTVVECDAAIQAVYEYRPLKCVTGRGGTDLRPPLDADFLRRHRPDVILYFTDGEGPAPKRPPRVPVIWCLVPRGKPPVSWGRVIRTGDTGRAHGYHLDRLINT